MSAAPSNVALEFDEFWASLSGLASAHTRHRACMLHSFINHSTWAVSLLVFLKLPVAVITRKLPVSFR